jgi:prevent-host-death family protein
MDMRSIGIRDFKNKATDIVRCVREDGETYLITVNGVPSAVLKPVEAEESEESGREAIEAWIARAEAIGALIEAERTDHRDCVELVAEQRR